MFVDADDVISIASGGWTPHNIIAHLHVLALLDTVRDQALKFHTRFMNALHASERSGCLDDKAIFDENRKVLECNVLI